MNRSPMKRKKTKRLREYEAEFERMKPLVRERSQGRCEVNEFVRLYMAGRFRIAVNTMVTCTGRGENVHHRKLRKQGGTNTFVNLLDTCLNCHSVIHSQVANSYECGLLVHEWESETL